MLASIGYRVLVAEGLQAALDNARQGPSLVIVCGPPPAETFTSLRAETRAPILALLPAPTEAETLAVLAAGADDCQPASIGNAEILSRVRALLRRARG